jgi:hypothetical protein
MPIQRFSFQSISAHASLTVPVLAMMKKRSNASAGGLKDNNLTFQPSPNLQLDCYVDANFTGL